MVKNAISKKEGMTVNYYCYFSSKVFKIHCCTIALGILDNWAMSLIWGFVLSDVVLPLQQLLRLFSHIPPGFLFQTPSEWEKEI